MVKNLEHVEVTFYLLDSDELLSVDLLHNFEVKNVEGVFTSFELHKRFKRLFVFYDVPRLGIYRLKL